MDSMTNVVQFPPLPVSMLGLSDVEIVTVENDSQNQFIFKVKSTKSETLCRCCGKPTDCQIIPNVFGFIAEERARIFKGSSWTFQDMMFLEIISKHMLCSFNAKYQRAKMFSTAFFRLK